MKISLIFLVPFKFLTSITSPILRLRTIKGSFISSLNKQIELFEKSLVLSNLKIHQSLEHQFLVDNQIVINRMENESTFIKRKTVELLIHNIQQVDFDF